MSEYETRVTQVHVVPTGQPIYCELGFVVKIEDESSGEFVRISSNVEGTMSINPEEWPALRKAIDEMVSRCKKGNNDD